VNAVVTNLPGPPDTRYMFGASIRRIVPIVPLAGNLDVSIAVLSYDGEVSFGCLADPAECPDLHVLCEGITATLESLAATAPAAAPRRRKKVAS